LATERDYYSILQVSRGADQEAIERAYQRLARLYDPAVSKKPKAQLRWQELNEAYEVLSDKQRRTDYDRRGVRATRPREIATSEPTSRRVAALAFVSSPYFFAGATVVGVFAAVLLLVLISVLGGSEGEEAVVTQPSLTPGATAAPISTLPTQIPVTPPSSPPEVTGEETTTESGLKYIVIQPGSGLKPQPLQTVVANYTGWLADSGALFDSSLDGSTPFAFTIGKTPPAVIAGWEEAFATMQVGEKRRLIIPADLAYGPDGRPGIPPNSTLIFDVELLAIQ
jgi:hypothetical protein